MTLRTDTRSRTAAFVAVVAVLAVMALPACGRFTRSDGSAARPTTTRPQDAEVGSDISISRRSTTTRPPRATTNGDGGGRTATTAPGGAPDPNCPPPPANAQQTSHGPSGFSVGVFVADKTCFGPKEPFFLTLSIVNNSKETRYHDPNQSEFFEITGNGKRWADRSCMPAQEHLDAPPSELGAGREAIFDARYPVPERSERSGDPCLLPRGQYQVVGILEWCPPASTSDGFCSPEESQPIRTPPVKIRIG